MVVTGVLWILPGKHPENDPLGGSFAAFTIYFPQWRLNTSFFRSFPNFFSTMTYDRLLYKADYYQTTN
jgi:hypothetical protein